MKKHFLFIAMALCTLTMSASEQTAKFKTETSVSTEIGIVPVIDSPMVIAIVETDQNIFVTAEIVEFGYCLSKSSELVFTLQNGSEVAQKHFNNSQCDVGAKLSIKLNPETLKSLSESPVASIQFKTDTGQYNIKTVLDKDFFVRNFKHKNYKFG